MQRNETLQLFQDNPHLSVLIIGGGINGIGVFRDLALQGIQVLLIDRGDFCSGASAASSHMVHGGIRYLENGEFRLVREAVRERNRLLRNAPHHVRPLPTTIPIFKWFSGIFNAPFKFLGMLTQPAERGGVIIKAGLIMYDAYTGKQATVPAHRFELRQTSLARHPHLSPQIVCTATYYDAAMNSPERICVELVLDTEADSPQAHALNYVSAVAAQGKTVTLRDEVTGETLDVQPDLIINAAGPWVDLTNQALGRQSRFMGGTKGSHLVLDNPALRAAIGENEFFFENDDGRIVLLYPLQDKVLVGTSDIPIEDPDDARCTDEEVVYFQEMIHRVFPHMEIRPEQILYRFSGVRPLPASDANTPGQISRDHSTRLIPAGQGLEIPILSLIGGKWTTFRAFAEMVTDQILLHLGHRRQKQTQNLAIGGGQDFPQGDAERQRWLAQVQQESGISMERVNTLFARYGTRAREIAAFMAAGPERPLTHLPTYSAREIRFLAQHEKVVHLDDLPLRRSLMAMLGQLTRPLVEELALILGETLRWSDSTRQMEIDRTLALLADEHHVILSQEVHFPQQDAG